MGQNLNAAAQVDENTVINAGLAGVLFQPLRIIDTPAGCVLHGLRREYPLMPDFGGGFGELYFSEILPGCVKAWKKHLRQTQTFMVPVGQIKIVLYDARKDSPTCGQLAEWRLGRPDNYGLLKIPPGVWYGFAAQGAGAAIICNCADLPHDPDESLKLPLDNDKIPYAWQ